MLLDEYDYNKLIKNVNTANTEIKILEQEDMDLPIPAIKQLRDVTYHIVKAFEVKKDDTEFSKQMKLAEAHAIRAKYDIYELRILWYLEDIKNYTKILTPIRETIQVIQDYSQLLTDVEEVKNNFEDNLNNKPANREAYYSNIKNEIQELKKIRLKLQTNLPLINRLYEERIANEKKEDKKTVRNYGIGLIMIIIAIVTLVLQN